MATEPKRKRAGELPNTAGNQGAIIGRIENKLGPVGPGHHNSHRTEALARWLEQKRKK